MYIKENMAMDYTKKGCEEEVKSHFHTGLNKDSWYWTDPLFQ